MDRVEYAFDLASLDLASVRASAGRINTLLVDAEPRPTWYQPTAERPQFAPLMLYIDIWAVKPYGAAGKTGPNARAEFRLLNKDGGVVADSIAQRAEHPEVGDYFIFPIVLTQRQYEYAKTLPPGTIENRME